MCPGIFLGVTFLGAEAILNSRQLYSPGCGTNIKIDIQIDTSKQRPLTPLEETEWYLHSLTGVQQSFISFSALDD